MKLYWRIGTAAGLILVALQASRAVAADLAADRAHSALMAFGAETPSHFRSWPVEYAGHGEPEWLRRQLPAAVAADRPALLLIAETFEHEMDWPAAVAAYHDAIAGATTPDWRLSARFGLARILSIISPAEGEAALAVLADDPQAGAAVAQLRARMAMTAGHPEAATKLLTDALSRAGRNPDPDTPSVVQSILADLSISTAQAGNTTLAVAYAVNSGIGAAANRAYVPQTVALPLCDASAGLLPEDAMIFEVAASEKGPSRVVPVWSNRPGASAAIALLGRPLMYFRWDHRPLPTVLSRGIRIQMSCSSGGSWSLGDSVTESRSGLDEWLSSQNVYGIPEGDCPPELLLKARVANLATAETRYGPYSLQLVPLLMQIARNPFVGQGAAMGHKERIFAILTSNGVPQPILAALQQDDYSQGSGENGDAAAASSSGLPRILAGFPAGEQNSPVALSIRYRLASAQIAGGETTAAAAGLRSLLAVPMAKLPSRDTLRRAAQGMLADIEDGNGHPAEADRLRHDAGFPTGLCRYANPPVTGIGISISEEDYPPLLRRQGVGGFLKIERRVASNGDMGALRIVYAQPPMLFDASALVPYGKGHNTVPMRRGKPFSCTANQTPIFWILAEYEARE